MSLDQTPALIGILGHHYDTQSREDSPQPDQRFIGITDFTFGIRQKNHIHPGIPIGDPGPPTLFQHFVLTDSGLRESPPEHELPDIDEQAPEE